jgi:hypothetical protein
MELIANLCVLDAFLHWNEGACSCDKPLSINVNTKV